MSDASGINTRTISNLEEFSRRYIKDNKKALWELMVSYDYIVLKRDFGKIKEGTKIYLRLDFDNFVIECFDDDGILIQKVNFTLTLEGEEYV